MNRTGNLCAAFALTESRNYRVCLNENHQLIELQKAEELAYLYLFKYIYKGQTVFETLAQKLAEVHGYLHSKKYL